MSGLVDMSSSRFLVSSYPEQYDGKVICIRVGVFNVIRVSPVRFGL